jgi:predicted HAD superfamily phosphohydrolase YqeG
VQRYVNLDIVHSTNFQVVGGQLHIDAFGANKVKFLSIIVMEMTHFTSDG